MKKLCIDLLNDPNAVVLDTGTTGLDGRAEIVELSVIDMAGHVLFDSLIRPSKAKAWPGAQRIHGIFPAEVVDVDFINGFVDVLWPLLNDKRIVVYNASYDKRLLQQSLEAAGVAGNVMDWDWVDVMGAYATFGGKRKLIDACQQHGVVVEYTRRALADCRMVLALLRKVAGVETATSTGSAPAVIESEDAFGFGWTKGLDFNRFMD